MKEKEKTKKQFINELKQLRRRIAELEALETERKRAEKALRESQQELQALMDSSPVAISWADMQGNIQYINRKHHELFGYTLEEIPIVAEWQRQADQDPAQRERFDLWLNETIEAQKHGRSLPPPQEMTATRKDGSIRHVTVEVTVVSDRTLVIYNDITERKQIEQALKRAYDELKDSEQRYRTLAENIDLKINLIDSDHNLLMVNAAQSKELNRPIRALIGKKCFREFEKRDAVCPHCPGVQTMATGKPAEVEVEGIKNDGSHYHARVQAFPVFGEDGTAVGFIEVADDITERKRAEEALQRAYDELKASKEREIERAAQLEASNRELEAFSYSVSHDLRTPLWGIDGFSQALLEDYADQLNTQGKDYLQRVRAASQRLERIIDDMLILSRVTRREMRRELVNLSTMAQEIAAELQASQPERQVSFVIAPGLVVKADPNLMRIALENLLDNAWKFTSKHPTARIEVGVTAHEGGKAYYVRDDGVGFDMAYAGKLFGAFQRLHPITDF
ncbi:Adaptive-response sensory-kinase SasA [subsurface metagenome]